MNEGDIVLFYRSQDKKELLSLGVVDSFFSRVEIPNQAINIIGKRSVFSKQRIEELLERPATIILFKHHFTFRNGINLTSLIEHMIIKSAPQSITKIEQKSYNIIKELGGIDERYTIN